MEKNYVSFLCYQNQFIESDKKIFRYDLIVNSALFLAVIGFVSQVRFLTISLWILYVVSVILLRKSKTIFFLKKRLILSIYGTLVTSCLVLIGDAIYYFHFIGNPTVFLIITFSILVFLWWGIYKLFQRIMIKRKYKLNSQTSNIGCIVGGGGALFGLLGVTTGKAVFSKVSQETGEWIFVCLLVLFVYLQSFVAASFVQLELFWKYPELEQKCKEAIESAK